MSTDGGGRGEEEGRRERGERRGEAWVMDCSIEVKKTKLVYYCCVVWNVV